MADPRQSSLDDLLAEIERWKRRREHCVATLEDIFDRLTELRIQVCKHWYSELRSDLRRFADE